MQICALLLLMGASLALASTEALAAAARAATPAEITKFLRFAPARPPIGSWHVDEAAISGRWALVGYYNRNAGVTALLKRYSMGKWKVIVRTGGQLSAEAMRQYEPTMDSDTANNLYALAVSQANKSTSP